MGKLKCSKPPTSNGHRCWLQCFENGGLSDTDEPPPFADLYQRNFPLLTFIWSSLFQWWNHLQSFVGPQSPIINHSSSSIYTYPSEKWWSESQLGWIFHSQLNGKSWKIPWFQSQPTSSISGSKNEAIFKMFWALGMISLFDGKE